MLKFQKYEYTGNRNIVHMNKLKNKIKFNKNNKI